jgi:hypothetical protein
MGEDFLRFLGQTFFLLHPETPIGSTSAPPKKEEAKSKTLEQAQKRPAATTKK